MSARNIFQVIPSGDNWEVRKNGQLLFSDSLKTIAVKKARQLAGNLISSQVLVYRSDGSVQLRNFAHYDA
jgi:hypothetical protein